MKDDDGQEPRQVLALCWGGCGKRAWTPATQKWTCLDCQRRQRRERTEDPK